MVIKIESTPKTQIHSKPTVSYLGPKGGKHP
jgi:hypothetical protein